MNWSINSHINSIVSLNNSSIQAIIFSILEKLVSPFWLGLPVFDSGPGPAPIPGFDPPSSEPGSEFSGSSSDGSPSTSSPNFSLRRSTKSSLGKLSLRVIIIITSYILFN